jgi:NAD(P)-dependent dehydrogenase (short-subunit alcohol dehydrogenase family)
VSDRSPGVVVITGASRGIGREFAMRYATAGARLALLARSAEGLEETLASVRDAGAEGLAIRADVVDDDAVGAAIERVAASLGPVDVLINNAGVGSPTGEMWAIDARRWWQTIEINLGGTVNCSRAVLPSMVARGRGRIINIVSNAGAHRWPYFTDYAVSKGAVIKLTESLAAELRSYDVSVFAAHPGLVRAGLTDAALGPGPPPPTGSLEARVRSWFERELAEGRTVSAAEAAEFIFELGSGRADALSGRYVAIEDDLEELIQRADEVRAEDLQVLALRRLRSTER